MEEEHSEQWEVLQKPFGRREGCVLGRLVQTAKVYAKTARGSAAALRGPLESRDSAAYGHSTVRAPRQANEMDILPLPGLWTSGTLSALPKGIQPLGELRKDSDAGDCARECTVIENGEDAVGRRVEVDMLLWVLGSHGGLKSTAGSRYSQQRFSSRVRSLRMVARDNTSWPATPRATLSHGQK